MRQPSAAPCPMPLPGPGGAVDLLTVSVSAREGYTLVSLDGEGDVTVRDQLRAALTAPVAAGTPHLVVDLSGLAYIDASCVQVLWRVSRMAEEAGGMLGLAAPQPVVARVMELWGAGQVIGVHDSVAKAAIAARQQRDSRALGTESPTVRGEDGRPGAAAVDGLLPRVARGDVEAFAGVYDQVAGAVLRPGAPDRRGSAWRRLGVVRERQSGTLEQLAVMPFRAWDVIAGKIAPYLIMATLDLVLIIAIGMGVFHVPFTGNVAIFCLGAALFLLVTLGMGVLVSTVSQNQGQVSRGEILGLLGANGAGKTTLIRLLLGLLRPSDGIIRLFGEAPSIATRRQAGYVPQTLGLYAGLTVAENWGFTAAAFHNPGVPLPADIAAWRKDLVGSLPLGAQRQVAFAVALSHKPRLLVLDEPTSGVGPLGGARLWEGIRQAASAGAGVLVTTHNMEEAEHGRPEIMRSTMLVSCIAVRNPG